MNQSQFQQAAGVSVGLATRWFPHIDEAMKEFGIVKPEDQAMFIAQSGHESAGFSALVESFNYTPAALLTTFGRRITNYQAYMLGRDKEKGQVANQPAIANLVYSNRYGNNAPGDGWKYRARGLIGITFLDNYRDCGNGLKVDLVAQPELLAQDEYAARSAAWFFASKGCMKYTGDLVRVTQIINGGQNGINDRRARYAKAKAALV